MLEPRAVARHYLAGWFLLDLVAALPFDLLAACQVNVVSAGNAGTPPTPPHPLPQSARIPLGFWGC